MKLTQKEKELIIVVLRTQISWGEGGCLIDDEGELDSTSVELAEKIIQKLKQ